MTIWKKAISVGTSAALLASLLATAVAPSAFAAATVTVITGSPVSISADTTGGAYTALTGPALVLGAAGDVTTGNLVFAAPAGFQFNTAAAAPAPTESVADPFTASAGTVTASTITYFVSVTNAAAITLTFTGWQVRPTAGTPLASGNLTLSASSTSTVNGVAAGTSLGTLTEIAGAASAAGSTLTASPASVVADGVTTSTLTATVRDQFGNPVPAAGTTTLAQTGGTVFATVVAGASGNPRTFTASSATAGTATFQATNSVGPLVITQTATVTFTAVVPPGPGGGSGASAVATSGFGNLTRGGTSAAGTFTITEGAIGDFVNGTVTVTPFSSSGVSGTGATAVWFDPASVPTATVTAGLGAITASVSAGGVLTITISGTTADRLDNFTVSGLKVKGGASAALGAVQFRYTTTGTNFGAINATATATVNNVGGTGTGVQSIGYLPDDAGVPLQNTATGATPPVSNATFSGGVSEATSISGVTGTALTATFSTNHANGSAISQTVAVSRFPTGATVVDTTVFAAATTPIVIPGLNTQAAGNLTVTLGDAGFVPAAATLTFAITTAGVQFSALPTATDSGDFAVGTGVLSLDRKSIVYTVTAASTTNLQVLTLSAINYDVALSATAGALVNVTLTISGGVAVSGSPAANAQIAQTIIGSGAVPTIIIGQNDQPTGLLTIRESAAGTLPDNTTVSTDKIYVCTTTAETFSRAPWFVRTAGDITFNVGGLPVTQAKATLTASNTCAFVTVYLASTVASTIQVRAGVDAANTAPKPEGDTNGATVNVGSGLTPGPTLVQVSISATTNGTSLVAQGAPVVVAMRALAGSPIVAAVSQPLVTAGGTNQVAGNVTITEGSAQNFVTNETISLCLVTQALTISTDTFFANTAGVGMPIVSTNNATSGLVATLTYTSTACGLSAPGFLITVNNGAIGALGVITVSGLKYNVNVGTASGPVFLRVMRTGAQPVGVDFNQVVSNASIGTAPTLPKLNIGAYSALGLKPTSGYTTATPKVTTVGKYVTWKFTGGTALAGQRVNVLVATKVGGVWTGPKYLKSAWADANGIVTFAWTSKTAAAINVRVQWPGSATYGVSTSKALGAYWK